MTPVASPGLRKLIARCRPWKAAAGWAAIALAALVAWRGNVPAFSAATRMDAIAVAEAIDRLPVVGSVLLTGAHPDDENNELLAYLAKALGLRTAYLSATRGDGGQNLIGTEQNEALGLLRTEELIAARAVDGAEQYFTQALDFGYSKSADETLEKWDRESVLGDYVRIIRRLRPDVVLSRFSGTPADGHGHHQSSGLLTREAFRAAADPSRFSEQEAAGLGPWQADRLLLNPGGASGEGEGFSMALGGFSPLYGRQFGDLGREARGSHRSQGMGGAPRSPSYQASFLHLDHAGPEAPKELFDGIDLTLGRFTRLSGGNALIAARVNELESLIQQARQALSPSVPEKALPALIQGLALVRQMRQQFALPSIAESARDHAEFLLEQKEEDFERAIVLAAGVRFTAHADSGEVVPGTAFRIRVSGEVQSRSLVQAGAPQLHAPRGWHMQLLDTAATSAIGRIEAVYRISVPADAPVSQPYWLVLPRREGGFNAAPSPWMGDAADPPLVSAVVPLTILHGQTRLPADHRIEVRHVQADRVLGEREQPVAVVPAIGVWLEPGVSVFPAAARVARLVRVRVRNHLDAPQAATVRLQLPAGWTSAPAERVVSFKERDEEFTLGFDVTAPPAALSGTSQVLPITATADSAGRRYSAGYTAIRYPHVATRYWFYPALGKLLRLNVRLDPGLQIGYIMGSGDGVATALQQLGVSVTLLGPDEVTSGDFRKYHVIITGIRAFEVRRDLVTSMSRLDDYVKEGGYLLVQYSRLGGLARPWAPYPMEIGDGPRVSAENAPVEMLVPGHALFQLPNRITREDFSGWVQERGTYFMQSWDSRFTALLASNDPGEPPQRGGMLVASYGKGMYAYTGYAWFRQLPAGNPGAYRILANLVSLGGTGLPASAR